MRPAGLESLPLGYIRLEFLENVLKNNGNVYSLIRLPIDNTPGVDTLQVVSSHYFQDVPKVATIEGLGETTSLFHPIGYSLAKQSFFCSFYGTRTNNFYFDFPIGKWATYECTRHQSRFTAKVDGLIVADVPSDFDGTKTNHEIGCFGRVVNAGAFAQQGLMGRKRFYKLYQNGVLVYSLVPALDPTGTPCMYDTVTKKPFYNAATTGSDFIAGFTMAQALNIAYLPANTTLTVSLPWEASLVQHNDEVEAALDKAEENGCVLTPQYREPEKDSPIYNKYAECTTAADIAAVNADYKTDLTIDGAWEYALPELERADGLVFANSNLKSFNSALPELSYASYMFYRAIRLTGWNIDLPKLTNSRYMFEQTRFTKFAGKLPVLNSASGMFLSGALTDFESDLPVLSYGGNMFNRCKLNKTSVLRILNTIPTWTSGDHPLTLGIHIDYQNDEEVLAAIALADIAQTPVADGGKGWTLTIQWNGTPTAQTVSTFGLRGPTIYAKLGTVERPDGTTENFLDWGHYVSNAEENGYQEFSSKEEAYEHFNLEMPSEEE